MKIINPTLHQIEAFVLACQLGSITAAAERMRLTQSAVSILLQQLERGLGARLLDRTTRSLCPTAVRTEMLPRAERMLRDREAGGPHAPALSKPIVSRGGPSCRRASASSRAIACARVST